MTKRNWLGITAIMLVVALIVGGLGFLSKGFKDWNWFDKDTDTEDVLNVLESNGIKLSFSLTSGGGENENIRRITATILPENATNKNVDWSIEWVNPASGWATGKNVSDYATITPISDGALIADLECLQAFGEQIKLSVTSRDNSEKNATCTVDYARRIKYCNISVSVLGDWDNSNKLFFSETNRLHVVYCEVDYDVGTTLDDFVFRFEFSLTDNFYAHLLSVATSWGFDTSLVKNNIVELVDNNEIHNPLLLLSDITEIPLDNENSLSFFIDVLNYNEDVLKIDVFQEGVYSSRVDTISVGIGGVDLSIDVDSINVDGTVTF